MRKRKGDKVDGWVVLDKPLGLGSTPAVGKVRRLFGAAEGRPRRHARSAGDAACCRSRSARRPRPCPFVMDGRKEYRFTLRFGEARVDRGRARARSPRPATSGPTTRRSAPALPAFIGEIEQMPPAFSALKIDGKRAYDLARAGETVELKPRTVLIERLELLGRPDADHADFVVGCGKGTYIRSLGRDLALALGTVGHLSALRRTAVGPVPGGKRPFRFPNWRPSGIFPRFSGPWPPSRPRWTTSRRWP